ncbi:DUF397 domain-containing protein [Thermoactinospora rubra]|uniref:DUF397 domain-containing protein n=1 Tax=Thermoactinospora rubra TaxID=1088767 RepID=UPI000A116B85|nr:DUF397 domain-containing protein [Thermoactinospora rubra]
MMDPILRRGWLRYSSSQGNCLEVTRDHLRGRIRVREKTNPTNAALLDPRAWAEFLDKAKNGSIPVERYHEGRVVVVIIRDEWVSPRGPRTHRILTTQASVDAFREGARASAFDHLPGMV